MSSPILRAATLIGLGLLCLGCPRPAVVVTESELLPTGDTLVVKVGELADAAWLGGTRFVTIAPQDRAVTLVDFSRRKVTPWGGAAARELEQPFHLFRGGDSVVIADWLRRRATIWSLNGALGGSVPAADRLRGALPRARDAAGRWYFELPPSPGPDGSGNRDSTALVRAEAGFGGADTVARLAPLDLAEVIADGRHRFERRLLSGQDHWGVLPDGTLWVARVSENRVDWRDPSGKWSEGSQLPDPVLPVTQNDRDLFLGRFDPGLRPTVEQIPFAAIKPPFEDALADPAGRVWLVKSRSVGDSVRHYQVIDHAGAVAALPLHRGFGRVLAVGDSVALVGEPFTDGVRLLLYRLPASPAGTP